MLFISIDVRNLRKLLFFIPSFIFFVKMIGKKSLPFQRIQPTKIARQRNRNDLNAAKRIKRRRNSSVRFSWHDIK